jgi:hypothetical protein
VAAAHHDTFEHRLSAEGVICGRAGIRLSVFG